jgi:hypothetical protein
MSALAAAFAESGHGILAGMSNRPRSPAGDPITLGSMRAKGVRLLDVSCWQCHHRAIFKADPWSDHVRRESGRPPFQTLSQIGNVITELPVGRAEVPPINGSVCAGGRQTF